MTSGFGSCLLVLALLVASDHERRSCARAQDLKRHVKGGFHKGAFTKHGHAKGFQSSPKGHQFLEGSAQGQQYSTGEALNEQVRSSDEAHTKGGHSRLRGAGKHSGMGVKGRLTSWQQKGVKGPLAQNPDPNADLSAAQQQSSIVQHGVKGKVVFQEGSMLQSSPEFKHGGRLLHHTRLKGGQVPNERVVENLKSAIKEIKSSHGTSFEPVSSAKKDVRTNLPAAAAAPAGPLQGADTKGRMAISKASITTYVSSLKTQQSPTLAQLANLNEETSPNQSKTNRFVLTPEEQAIKKGQGTGFNNVAQQDARGGSGVALETQQGNKLVLTQSVKGRLAPNGNVKSSLPLSSNVQINGAPNQKVAVKEIGSNKILTSGIVPGPPGKQATLESNIAFRQQTKGGPSSVLGIQQGIKQVQQMDFKGRVAPGQDLKNIPASKPQGNLLNAKTVQGAVANPKLGIIQADGRRFALTQQTQGTVQSLHQQALKGRLATSQNLNSEPLHVIKGQQGLKQVRKVGLKEQGLKSNLLSAPSAKQIVEPVQSRTFNEKIPEQAFQTKVTSVQERQQVVQSSQQSLSKKLLPNQTPNVGPASASGVQQQVQQAREVKGKMAPENNLKSLALNSKQVAETASGKRLVNQSPNGTPGLSPKTQQTAQSSKKASVNAISGPTNSEGLKLGFLSASGTQQGSQPTHQRGIKGRVVSTGTGTTLLSVQKDQSFQNVPSNVKTVEALHKGQYQDKKSDVQARLAAVAGASVQSQGSAKTEISTLEGRFFGGAKANQLQSQANDRNGTTKTGKTVQSIQFRQAPQYQGNQKTGEAQNLQGTVFSNTQNSVQASQHSSRAASGKTELTQQQIVHKAALSQVAEAKQELGRVASSNINEQQQQYHHSHVQHQHQLQQRISQQQQN